jgi:hypothetical protein
MQVPFWREARGSIPIGVGATGWDGGPIGLGEFHAPEVRRWRQEFDAYALALAGIVAEVNDAGFLFFLSEGIGDDELRVVVERLRENEQGAVRIDDDGLAGFAEAFAVAILACHDDAQAHENAGAAAVLRKCSCWGHLLTMLREACSFVNGREDCVCQCVTSRKDRGGWRERGAVRAAGARS